MNKLIERRIWHAPKGRYIYASFSSFFRSTSEGLFARFQAQQMPIPKELEFQQFVTPDDGRKFTELYNVQHLQSAQLDRVSRVCISTIQRLYSMLRSFFFSIETLMPQGPITRGDRQRSLRVQRTAWNAVSSALVS